MYFTLGVKNILTLTK